MTGLKTNEEQLWEELQALKARIDALEEQHSKTGKLTLYTPQYTAVKEMKIGASRTFKVSNIASFQTGLHKMARQEGIGIRTMKISDNEVVVARVSGEAEEEKAA